MCARRPKGSLGPHRALYAGILRQLFQMRGGLGPTAQAIGGKARVPIQLWRGIGVGDPGGKLEGLRVHAFRQVGRRDAVGEDSYVLWRSAGLNSLQQSL